MTETKPLIINGVTMELDPEKAISSVRIHQNDVTCWKGHYGMNNVVLNVFRAIAIAGTVGYLGSQNNQPITDLAIRFLQSNPNLPIDTAIASAKLAADMPGLAFAQLAMGVSEEIRRRI